MPLHLAQHKSYHPYSQVNRERVRRDEAIAALEEKKAQTQSFTPEDQEHLSSLRDPSIGKNQPHASRVDYSSFALIRPSDELKPWYANSDLKNGAERQRSSDQLLEAVYKDGTLKSSHDPLKAMESFLAQRKLARQQKLPSVTAVASNHVPTKAKGSRSSNIRRGDRAHKYCHRPSLERHDTTCKASRRGSVGSHGGKVFPLQTFTRDTDARHASKGQDGGSRKSRR